MKFTRTLVAAALAAASVAAFAQTTTAGSVQRDVNQQTRIENGLQSGQLTTREAASLENKEKRVDNMQARDMKDGKMTPAETARLDAAQNKVSRDIAADKSNAAIGHPNSVSSQRMQADVARNVTQQQRIEQGVKSGELTNHETARLERGQAKVDRKEAMAGANGHVRAGEQARINRAENHQSRVIHRQKHDAQVRG